MGWLQVIGFFAAIAPDTQAGAAANARDVKD
jgi:hypothetical protein